MDKKDIEEYIKKLQELDKELSEDDDDVNEGDFMKELNKVLNGLTTDIQNEMVKSNPISMEVSTKVNFKKLHKDAVTPSYSKDGDAGMDLTITTIISETTTDVTYGFGIALEIPKNYVGLVFPRSSVRKYDLSLTNCVGVIDSGYRGEIQATFKKTSWLKGDSADKYVVGDRGAQIIILPYPKITMVETEELSDTERGDGGFGSTGK
jgi:dUTP pyrophosphatase